MSERTELREFLQNHFNLNELKELTFDLGISYESFPHQTTSELSRELVDYFTRRQQLSCLIIEILKKRPHAHFMTAWLSKLSECIPLTAVTESTPTKAPTHQISIQPLANQHDTVMMLTCMLEVATGSTQNLENLVAFMHQTNWYGGNEVMFRQKMAKATHLSGHDLLIRYQANSRMSVNIAGNSIDLPQELITGHIQGAFEHVFVKFDENVHFTETPFQYPPVYQQFCHDLEQKRVNDIRQSGAKLFDGANLRLSGLELVHEMGVEKIKTVHQPVYYFKGLGTNLSLDIVGKKGRTLRELVHYSGQLDSLQDSIMANPIGINLLVISSDNQIILQHRQLNLAVRPGEACSSTSGTVDKDDAHYRAYHPILRAVYREMFEEIGLEKHFLGDIIFLGAVREFLRGGLPDFFFTAKAKLTEEEIINAAKFSGGAMDEWEWEDIPDLSILPPGTSTPETEMMRFEFFLHKYLEVLTDLKQPDRKSVV